MGYDSNDSCLNWIWAPTMADTGDRWTPKWVRGLYGERYPKRVRGPYGWRSLGLSLSLIEDPISTVKVESYELAWNELALDVGPLRDWCFVNLNSDLFWVVRTQEHVVIHCETFPRHLSLHSFVDLSWILIRKTCRTGWTHKIGNPLRLSSHPMLLIFLGSYDQAKGKDKIMWCPYLFDVLDGFSTV